MSQYEAAIAALKDLDAHVAMTVQAVRSVDKLLPSQVRTFNGEMDDLMIGVQRLQPARERLLQRTAGSDGPDIAVPQNAAALADGLR